jgi:hypothetical protein
MDVSTNYHIITNIITNIIVLQATHADAPPVSNLASENTEKPMNSHGTLCQNPDQKMFISVCILRKHHSIQGSPLVHVSKLHVVMLFFFLLFVCAYNVWVISPFFPPPPPSYPQPPYYQAETILSLSLILLKREYKQ